MAMMRQRVFPLVFLSDYEDKNMAASIQWYRYRYRYSGLYTVIHTNLSGIKFCTMYRESFRGTWYWYQVQVPTLVLTYQLEYH